MISMLTTDRVCYLCDLSSAVLQAWLREGGITPAHQGTKGRNSGHRFSTKQVLGLAVASGIRSALGCSAIKAGEIVREFEGVPDESLSAMLDFSPLEEMKVTNVAAVAAEVNRRLENVRKVLKV